MGRGFFYVALSSVVFGCNGTINKYVISAGMTEASNAFWLQVILFLGALIMVGRGHYSLKISRKQLLWLMLMGITGLSFTAVLCNLSFRYISVGLTTMLHFLYPTLVTVTMTVLFRERLGKLKLIAICCSICGMFCLLAPDGELNLLGVICALGSSVTYSVYIIINDKSCVADLPQPVKMFYAGLTSLVSNGMIAAASGGVALPKRIDAILLLIFCSGLGYLLAHYFLSCGIRIVGAAKASFFNMLEPITSMIVSTLVYKDPITVIMSVGCVLIVSSVFLVAKSDNQIAGSAAASPVKQSPCKK